MTVETCFLNILKKEGERQVVNYPHQKNFKNSSAFGYDSGSSWFTSLKNLLKFYRIGQKFLAMASALKSKIARKCRLLRE